MQQIAVYPESESYMTLLPYISRTRTFVVDARGVAVVRKRFALAPYAAPLPLWTPAREAKTEELRKLRNQLARLLRLEKAGIERQLETAR